MRDDDFFWEGARDGELLIQRCGDCRTFVQPPLPMCSTCQSLNLAPVQCSGRGEVLSWVVSKHPTRSDAEERVVVLVQLEEGVRLISNLQGAPIDAIQPGLPVEVFFQAFDEVVLPQFRPAGAA
jgi:uncharacterized OB-fold protein